MFNCSKRRIICACKLYISKSNSERRFRSVYGGIYDRTPERLKEKKNKDPYKYENLPIFDYEKINMERKRLYVWGGAVNGQLGLPNLLSPVTRRGVQKAKKYYSHCPIRNPFGDLNYVQDAAVGHGFTLVSLKPKSYKNHAKEVSVFATGLNSFSQIGYHSDPDLPKDPFEVICDFVPISLPLKGNGRNALALAAGKSHSLISIENEGVFTLGDNSEGQCGRFIVPDEEYFGSKIVHRVPQFGSNNQNDQVIHLAANYNVSYCLTKIRQVYSFGENHQGQLGRGKLPPKPWEAGVLLGDIKGEEIAKIVTNGSSTMALSENGELFVWGANECWQLSPTHDEGKIFYDPVFSPMPEHVGKIKDIAIGDQYSLILNEEGNVFSWGQGRSLGLGPSNLRVRHPTIIPPPLFGRSEFYPEVRVRSISSGFFFSSAINSHGDMYVWGQDSTGCLGLGNHPYQSFPLKIAMSAHALKAIHSIDHTIVLAKAI